MFRPAEPYSCGKDRLLRLLAEMETSGSCREALYLPHDLPPPESLPANLREAVAFAGESETGLALFVEEDRLTAVAPPFPLARGTGDVIEAVRGLLGSRLKIGVVLIRLGRYGVGVLEGDTLVASKTGTRHVKNRHRAGGSSQRRFERSRERLIRELFDKTCQVARDTLSPHFESLDYVMLGGDKTIVRRFVDRCDYLKRLGDRTLARRLLVDQPNQKALEGIGWEVWKSRVLVLEF